MKIQIGEITLDKVTEQKITRYNRTRKYLLPVIKEYGDVFMKHLNNVFKVAVGIGDMIVNNRKELAPERHLFILLDSKTAPKYFIQFMKYIKDHHSYVDDYVYDDIQKSTFHMVILKFPERFNDTIKTFKEGKYSKMFDKETLDTFFKKNPEAMKVFIKDRTYIVSFTRKLNRKFNSNINPDEWDGEADLPPTEEMEIFNHHLK